MTALATIEELKARLDWELTPEEERVGVAALDDLSEWARYYGRPHWEGAQAPALVKRMVLAAAARHMQNPDGYETSRAGDETVTFQKADGDPGSASFSRREIEAIGRIARPGSASGLHSLQVTAHETRLPEVTAYRVPTADGGSFPLFAGEGPW